MIVQQLKQAEPLTTGAQRREIPAHSQGVPLYFSLTVETGKDGRAPWVHLSYAQGPDRRFQSIDHHRLLVPWAAVPSVSSGPLEPPVPSLIGGDAKRGEALFFSEQARCSQCHAFRGRGVAVGPDLTNAGSKGKVAIYRSIAAPSAEISPEYVSYTVATREGKVLGGLVRAEGAETISVTDTSARTFIVRRDEIEQIRPSGTSIMPVGLSGVLGEAAVRDLVAFLGAGR
jgi:putative heme-binding domain-containing protein